MSDDFDADEDLLAALAASDAARSRPQPMPGRIQQPTPQKIQQPIPQRLDKAPPSESSNPKIVQPTPQALPQRSPGSSIQVSPRQRGNPVLASLRSLPWEYSDIPADYVLGQTTCALFLSLKYHRLHPEYIYTRIRNLQGKYQLRILLTMVDIPNHEDSLRELSKTSLVNNVTIILCWSAAEAARYLELYKSYEHANFAAIRGQQASSYAEKLVEFVTVPRSVNKADAIALVCNFGSLKDAINAEPEQIGILNGWGEKKVKKWCKVVEEPFRTKKASKRKLGAADGSSQAQLRETVGAASTLATAATLNLTGKEPARPGQFQFYDPDLDDSENEGEQAMAASAIEKSKRTAESRPSGTGSGSGPGSGSTGTATSQEKDVLSDGVAAALARLRENA